MKKLFQLILTLSLVVLPLMAQPDAPVKLVVLDLKSPGNEGVVLADRLNAEFIKGGLYEMISRDKRDAAVKELAMVAADEPFSLTKVGQKLKADIVVGGSVGQLGDTWSLSLVAVNVATGKAEHHLTKSYKGKVDGLLLLADGFVKQVSAERAKQVKAVQAEKADLTKRSEALKARKAELEKKREAIKAQLAKDLEAIDKKEEALGKEHQLAGEKIAAHDKKTEEMKAAGKKPATDPAKARALLVKKQEDIAKKKEALNGDREKARAAAAKADEETVKEIGLVEKAQWEVAQKQKAFEPKPPEPEPTPAVVDTVKKPEPPKKPVKKGTTKTKQTTGTSTGKPKANPAD
jgi:hypothetical protein